MRPAAAASFLPFLLLAAVVSAEVVLDSDGNSMRNGGNYYLSPSTSVGGGGIISAAIRHGDSNLCSLAVVSALYTNGWAVTISTPAKITSITTSLPLNLAFAYLAPNVCTDSPNWVVVETRHLGRAVMLGGAQEFGGAANVRGSFYIKTHDSEKRHYKLVFCEQGKEECGNIGIKVDSAERRRLVVTDEEPLVLRFDKAASKPDLSMVV